MATSLSNPHDRFFKELFSRQEAARDFLQNYLPADVAQLLDLASLEISKDSFIDADLQEHFSDLLYTVALRDGRQSYVYVLFEHKSYPEELIAFQLLKYMVKIWDQSLKQAGSLQPIIPLVIYHGQRRWSIAPEFSALFDLAEPLKSYLPNFQ